VRDLVYELLEASGERGALSLLIELKSLLKNGLSISCVVCSGQGGLTVKLKPPTIAPWVLSINGEALRV
jgi:hypothetical protein